MPLLVEVTHLVDLQHGVVPYNLGLALADASKVGVYSRHCQCGRFPCDPIEGWRRDECSSYMPVIAATLFTDGMTRYVAACMLVSPAVVCLCTLGDKPAARGCAIQNWALLTIDLRVYVRYLLAV